MKKQKLIFVLTVSSLFSFSIAFASTLLITHEKSNSVSIVDTDTDQIVKTVQVGETPHAIAITPKRHFAYTGNRGDNTLSVIELKSMNVVKTIKVPHSIMNLEISPDGRYVSVNSRTSLHVSFIDTATNTIVKTIEVGHGKKRAQGRSAVNMGDPNIHARKGGIMISHDTWSPNSQFLFVPDRFNYKIAKIDIKTFEVLDHLQLETPTHHILVTPNGRSMIALNDGVAKHNIPPSIIFFSIDTLKIEKRISISLAKGEFAQGHHAGYNLDKTRLYFANRGKKKGEKRGKTVAIVDLKEHKLIKTVESGYGAGHANASPDGKYIFILNHFDNVVSVLDANSNTMIKNIKLPLPSDSSIGHSGVFSKDSRYYYELCETEGKLLKINVESLTFSKEIKIGDWPSIMVQLD